MKIILAIISIFCSSFILLEQKSISNSLNKPQLIQEKKQWKAPELKEGQTIQEAFDELRQNRNIKIEKRKQDAIQERKNDKRIEKASRSEIVKERKEQKKQEKQDKGFDFNKKSEKRDKKKLKRSTKSQIDRLDPRKTEINDLMDLEHENILLEDENSNK